LPISLCTKYNFHFCKK